MKKIYVDYIGFWRDFDKENNFISDILKKKCEVVVSNDPEFVFVSSLYEPFEFAKYDCVRVFFSAEPESPDFVSFDYCIGYDHIDAGDRYLRYPYYVLRWNEKQTEQNGGKYSVLSKDDAINILNGKNTFCNFIYSHDVDSKIRQRVFEKVSEYKKVDSAGSFLNNQPDGYRVKYGNMKDDFLRKSKFTLSIESLVFPGHTSEKIIEPFLCHSVPIYYGDPTVSDYFNTKSFIQITDENNLDLMLERIIELDQDDEKYIEMLMQNPFIEEDHIKQMNDRLEKMLFDIVLQDPDKAYRRVRLLVPLYHDNCLKKYHEMQEELDAIKSKKLYWILKKIGK